MSLCPVYHIPATTVAVKETSGCISPDERERGLAHLRSQGIELVVFDSVEDYRNAGITIFDGQSLLDLPGDLDNYGALPDIFRVLNEVTL
jgi:hypothetical protein